MEKLYYTIGEVSQLLDIPESTIRYWEKEFPFIIPKKRLHGRRVYRKDEIEKIKLIKELLYDKKFTIEGAKKYFYNLYQESSLFKKVKDVTLPSKRSNKRGENERAKLLKDIKKELLSIIDFLDNFFLK